MVMAAGIATGVNLDGLWAGTERMGVSGIMGLHVRYDGLIWLHGCILTCNNLTPTGFVKIDKYGEHLERHPSPTTSIGVPPTRP